MKVTIEIADNLLIRAKTRASKEHITLCALIEKSLAAALDRPHAKSRVKPVIFEGNGLNPEFVDATWDKIRDTISR